MQNNQKLIKYSLKNHRLYGTWHNMIQRCNNKKYPTYKDYGLRGIKVCSYWYDSENFIKDMYPSYKEGLTLDRIDTNGNYEPNNCRWVNKSIQSRNTRKIRSTNKSGYRGVSFRKDIDKCHSSIKVNNKKIHLGYFTDKIEAAKAYDNYVIKNNLEHTKNF